MNPSISIDMSLSPPVCELTGNWSMNDLAKPKKIQKIQDQLATVPKNSRWNLEKLDHLDSVGAYLLWEVWGHTLPSAIDLPDEHKARFLSIAQVDAPAPQVTVKDPWQFVISIGQSMFALYAMTVSLIQMGGQFFIDLFNIIRKPSYGPWRETSAQIFQVGAQAVAITALVGFLIGVVLSFLTAQQLRIFGADTFIVNLLGISILRELGPLLAAILVAGRSGSAMTAQIGVMRVTQELDAMLVMGIPHGRRLVFPRILGLMIALPLLVVWTNIMALLGGAISAWLQLDLSPLFFAQQLHRVVPVANYFLGVGKGVVFGACIAMIACQFGFRVQPNTQSLGQCTTSSVVTSITCVILIDAVFAIIFRGV